MIPTIGLPSSMLRDPYWYNAETDQLVEPYGKHHYHMFTYAPETVGVDQSELNFRPSREENQNQWEITYTDMVIARAWTRIDVVGDGTIVIVAGRLDWAEAALRMATEIATGPITRVIAVVFPHALGTHDDIQRFDLIDEEIPEALAHGLESWAKPTILAMAPKSKMAKRPGRCPFGFGGRR